MRTHRIDWPDIIATRWHRECRRAWPLEAFAYLLGRRAGLAHFVEGIWLPADLERFSTPNSLSIPQRWMREALEHAEDEGLEVIGDIHSHPYPYSETNGAFVEAIPSEGDHAQGWHLIAGVTALCETQSGRKLCRTRFYAPADRIRIT